eukprot:TRINITY_DN1656_c1_g1_i1.p1 TRINITY_DN1656_c1_g1~~TRINITY_DN1656_c1_g1_i1.p1  ORF type:complete len:971 (-),score=251.91 TRINITY_DN1656_c1_g1_i1:220-3132(-)
MGECNVRVVVRFRPVNWREQEEFAGREAKQLIRFGGTTSVEIVIPGNPVASFNFDYVFPPTTTQEGIYDVVAKKAVEDVLEGFNGTIFAYGQTGSGKSHTMMGPDGSLLENPQERGIIPRAACHIFNHVENGGGENMEFFVKCSYLEIYNETICDLLDKNKRNLSIHENPSRGVWISDLTEEYISEEEDVIRLIQLGGSNRAVSATNMNKVSSRSHSVFILMVEQKSADGSTKTGKLNLVDLAGSEKVGKTGATGQTLEEAKKINQSLSALGNCIHALTETKKNKHVPYRDSKLTHILKESLGGNTKTCMMIACSPHEFNIEETKSTLQFGQRAKTIKNSVKVNKQLSVAELQAMVSSLTRQLQAQTSRNTELEAIIEYMKSPSYDPSKGLPANFSSTLAVSTAPKVDEATKKDGEDGEQEALKPSGLNAIALAEVELELTKLKESTTITIEDLRQEVEFLKEREDQHTQEMDKAQAESERIKEELASVKLQLENERAAASLTEKRLTYQAQEDQLQVEETRQQITDLESLIRQLEDQLSVSDAERANAEKVIVQLEKRLASGEGGSGANVANEELEQYVVQLDQELAKIQKENADMETRYTTQQTRISELVEKVKTLQGELSDADARALQDQETLLTELNAMTEKQGELEEKLAKLEAEAGDSRGALIDAEQARLLVVKQMAVVQEENKYLKEHGAVLPEDLDEEYERLNGILTQMSKEHAEKLKSVEANHRNTVSALHQQVRAITAEKQHAERRISDHEATANMAAQRLQTETKSLKQGLEAALEENKRLKQKVLTIHTLSAIRSATTSTGQSSEEGSSRIRTLEANLRKMSDALENERRALQSEQSKSATNNKRMEQQANRIKEVETELANMVKEQFNLKALVEELSKREVAASKSIQERDLTIQDLKLENQQLLLRPRGRIFKPLKNKSILEAFEQKIDFSTIALRTTGSRYLDVAREEAKRADAK